MIELWLGELVKAVGRLFLNPMLYWGIILLFAAGYVRFRRERRHFGLKINPLLTETEGMGVVSLVAGLGLTAVMIGAGFVFSYETILVLNLTVILLSLSTRYTLLSAAYTAGLAFTVLYLGPKLLPEQLAGHIPAAGTNFTGLAVLAGLLLVAEAMMLHRVKQDETLPELIPGKRGKWIGQHHLKKLSIIPFFVLIPYGPLLPFADYWPYVTIGGSSFGLLLVPMVLGFDYKIRTELPMLAKQKLAGSLLLLGILVTIAAGFSLIVPVLAPAAVCIAFLGKEWIHFRHRRHEDARSPYFHETRNGLEVLAVLPGSPADRLEIKVGEQIKKVNGRLTADADELYEALQTNGSFCKLEIIGHDGEKRIEQTALYNNDHHHLGLILVGEPYRTSKQQKRKTEPHYPQAE